VLIAASFREKKGIPYALEALGILQQETEVQITIIGDAGASAPAQAEKARILAALTAHGLEHCTRMLGFQPYRVLFEEAYQHHVFLSPSVTAANGDTEGGAPVTLIEMAATGMPIVSTRHCDIPEVVEDGVSGLLAEERDVSGLVERLRWLVEHPECWRSLTLAGRKRMEEQFDSTRLGSQLAAHYAEMCLGSRAA
jgi:colanic acid/amylovoran biosynthesis glycosyltransferase